MKVNDKRFSKRLFFENKDSQLHIFHYADGNITVVVHYGIVDNCAESTTDFFGAREEGIKIIKNWRREK